MAGAMLQACFSLIGNSWKEVWILRISEGQRQKLLTHSDYTQAAPHIRLVSSLSELQRSVDEKSLRFTLIILGMKPQVIRKQLKACLPLGHGSLWLTMAAGLPLSWYKAYQQDLRIIRLMPNLGAQVGQGANLLYADERLQPSAAEKEIINTLVHRIGKAVWCKNEAQLDNATPVTGSGPAYFYLLTELLQLELQKRGFAPHEAANLAEATFLGAAAYLADTKLKEPAMSAVTDDSCNLAARLRQAVTSKAGVTEAALSVLEPQLQAALAQAIDRGIQRNGELCHAE